MLAEVSDHHDLSASFWIRAFDGDGQVLRIELCGEGSCDVLAEDTDSGPLTCVQGDRADLVATRDFPAFGTYEFTVRVTGAACLDLLEPETIEESLTVTVTPEPEQPPLVPTDIPCFGEGTRTASDVGVSDSEIVLGYEHGRWTASSVGAEGVTAAARSINAAGGVCGRRLRIETLDSGSSTRDLQYGLAANDRFAYVGVHLSEIDEVAGEVEQTGTPFIGTGGRAFVEGASPRIWQLGPSEETIAEVMVDEASDAAARTFAIVHDSRDPYASRIEEALRAKIASEPEASLAASTAVQPGQATYSADIQSFNQACFDASGCDATIYLLGRSTFRTWMRGRPANAAIRTSLWPELAGERVARDCFAHCDGHVVWSPFEWPLDPNDRETGHYTAVMYASSPPADRMELGNLLGYEAVMLAARALGRAGPNPTRDSLASILDTELFATELAAEPLSWDASREPNTSLRGYQIVVAQGSFAGYRDLTGWRSAND